MLLLQEVKRRRGEGEEKVCVCLSRYREERRYGGGTVEVEIRREMEMGMEIRMLPEHIGSEREDKFCVKLEEKVARIQILLF